MSSPRQKRYSDLWTETAKAMGKSVNAVKSLQLRALLSLRRHLEAGGFE